MLQFENGEKEGFWIDSCGQTCDLLIATWLKCLDQVLMMLVKLLEMSLCIALFITTHFHTSFWWITSHHIIFTCFPFVNFITATKKKLYALWLFRANLSTHQTQKIALQKSFYFHQWMKWSAGLFIRCMNCIFFNGIYLKQYLDNWTCARTLSFTRVAISKITMMWVHES